MSKISSRCGCAFPAEPARARTPPRDNPWADFDEELLTALAEAGGGETYFIENPDQIPEIFRRELQGLLSVVAQNVVVSFRPAQGCRIGAAWGYTFSSGPDGLVTPGAVAGASRYEAG